MNPREEDEGAEKEGMSSCGAHAPPFPWRPKNPSPTDFPTRKKHNAVPSQLLNADPLAQIIGTETVADVIIDDDGRLDVLSLCGSKRFQCETNIRA